MKATRLNLFTRNHFSLGALLFLALISCNTGPKQEKKENDLVAAANQLDSLFLVAFNKGDADAIMNLHWNSPDLRAYPPGEPQLNGYEAVKASYLKDFEANKGAKLEYTSTHNIPFADVVIGHGTFTWTMPVEGAPADSPPMVFNGRYSEVKAVKDGKMVIVLDHTSMPMAPPAEEPKKI